MIHCSFAGHLVLSNNSSAPAILRQSTLPYIVHSMHRTYSPKMMSNTSFSPSPQHCQSQPRNTPFCLMATARPCHPKLCDLFLNTLSEPFCVKKSPLRKWFTPSKTWCSPMSPNRTPWYRLAYLTITACGLYSKRPF